MKIKIILFGFLILTIINCQSKVDKLKGHWHKYDDNDIYYTLDIYDSLSILNLHSIEGFASSPLYDENTKIFFPYGHHGYITNYFFKGDTLFLDNYRFLRAECTWEDTKLDFFSHLNTLISLSYNNNSIPIDSIEYIGVIHCGYRKDSWIKSNSNLKKDEVVIQVSDTWISIDELTINIDAIMRRHPDSINYNFILNIHKDIVDSVKFEVINIIKQNPKVSLYQSFINEDKKCIGLIEI